LLAVLLVGTVSGSHAQGTAGNRKHQKNEAAAPAKQVGHVSEDADAETFNRSTNGEKHMEISVRKAQGRNGNLQSDHLASQKKAQQANPLNSIGNNINKLFKKASAGNNNPLNVLTNTLKNVGNPLAKKPVVVKKSKSRVKPGSSSPSNRPPSAGKGGGPAKKPEKPEKPADNQSSDYTDVEVDENGNPVVETADDEEDEEPDETIAEKSADQNGGEEFPPYGGDYSQVDEGPVQYPDENPQVPPKKNKNNKGNKNKGKGKKQGGKKPNNKKKRKKNNIVNGQKNA